MKKNIAMDDLGVAPSKPLRMFQANGCSKTASICHLQQIQPRLPAEKPWHSWDVERELRDRGM